MSIVINPDQYVEGIPFGRRKLIENQINIERKDYISRNEPYTRADFEKSLATLETQIPKIKGLYVVIGGELKFNKVF